MRIRVLLVVVAAAACTGQPATTGEGTDPTVPAALPNQPVAVIDADGRLELMDAGTGEPERTLAEGIPVNDPDALGVAVGPGFETVYFVRPAADPRRSELLAVSSTGGEPRSLGEATAPAVSPEGDRIAYVSLTGARPFPEVVVRDLETGEERRYGLESAGDIDGLSDLAWTPDGDRLALVDGKQTSSVWLLDLASADSLDDVTPLGPIDREGCPAWSQVAPLGGSLAVVERCEDREEERHAILRVDPESGEVVEVLAEREGPIISLEAGPDLERIVYVTDFALDQGGTLRSWAAEPHEITDGVFAAGW